MKERLATGQADRPGQRRSVAMDMLKTTIRDVRDRPYLGVGLKNRHHRVAKMLARRRGMLDYAVPCGAALG